MKRRRQTPYYKNRTLRKTKRTASHRRHRSRTHNNMGHHHRRGKRVRIVGG